MYRNGVYLLTPTPYGYHHWLSDRLSIRAKTPWQRPACTNSWDHNRCAMSLQHGWWSTQRPQVLWGVGKNHPHAAENLHKKNLHRIQQCRVKLELLPHQMQGEESHHFPPRSSNHRHGTILKSWSLQPVTKWLAWEHRHQLCHSCSLNARVNSWSLFPTRAAQCNKLWPSWGMGPCHVERTTILRSVAVILKCTLVNQPTPLGKVKLLQTYQPEPNQ